jgi:hypothetical protein
VLTDATLVVDHFHAIRLASEAVNDVRRRVQQDTVTVAASMTRSTGSAASCCGPGRTSTSGDGTGCGPGSPPATPTEKWALRVSVG